MNISPYISLTLVVDDLCHAGGVRDLERLNPLDVLCVFFSSLEEEGQPI